MPDTMKAVVKHDREKGLRLIEVPKPQCGPDTVLVKVKASSICGSDLPIFNWDDPWVRKTIQPGQIIGHEFCGEVIDVGSNVTSIERGLLVTAEGHINCHRCNHCRTGQSHLCPYQKLIGFDYPGAFAEYINVPASNIIDLSGLSVESGAIQDPFGNAVHAALRIRLSGQSVLITGCGPLGLMVVRLVKYAGARQIIATDISRYRLDLAKQFGADYVIDVKDQDAETFIMNLVKDEAGVDVLLEMSGVSDAINQGFRILRPGGTAIMMGLPKSSVTFDFANELIAKGITVHGLVGRVMFDTWIQSLMLQRSETNAENIDVSKFVTHRFMLDQYEDAFSLMQSGLCGKIILYPSADDLNLYATSG